MASSIKHTYFLSEINRTLFTGVEPGDGDAVPRPVEAEVMRRWWWWPQSDLLFATEDLHMEIVRPEVDRAAQFEKVVCQIVSLLNRDGSFVVRDKQGIMKDPEHIANYLSVSMVVTPAHVRQAQERMKLRKVS